jgi:AcrR family transcriptional regulator
VSGGAATKTGRRTQRERREATIAKLLQATIDTIVEVGYARTSIKEVCDRAGVSHGGLFRHFATREELVVAAAAEVADRLLANARRQLAGRPVETADDIEAAVRYLREAGRTPENAVFVELLVASRTDAGLAAKLRPFEVAYYLQIYRVAAEVFGITEDPGRRFEAALFGIISLFEAENLGRLVYVDADMEERRLQLVVDFAQHTLRGLLSPPD